MLNLEISRELSLETFDISDASALFECVDSNRAYLKSWLPWLDYNLNAADSESFISSTLEDAESGKSLILAIKLEGLIVGTVGFISIEPSTKIAEIGYWLAEHQQGKGIVTSSLQSLIEYAEIHLGIKTFQISAGSNNARSRRIPESLGFTLVGVIEDAEWLYDHHVDHARYLLEK